MGSFIRPRSSKIRTGDIRHRAMSKRLRRDNAYAVRDRVLFDALGYSYQEYLESDLWKFIRAAVLGQANGICKGCGAEATEVHHLKYNKAVLLGKNFFKKPPKPIEALVALCRGCHERIEFCQDGKKTSFRGMRKKYKRMIEEASPPSTTE